jgi:hypothetical protein
MLAACSLDKRLVRKKLYKRHGWHKKPVIIRAISEYKFRITKLP